MSDIDPRLFRICEAYTRTVREKDVSGFLNLYHPTARVFDTWGAWSYEGDQPQREAGRLIPAEQQIRTGPARRKVIEQWFGSLGEERVAVTFDRVQTTVTSDLAALTARVVYAAISPTGAELRSMQNRLTWVLKPDGDGWKIIHEHTSVPLGPDLKGLLAREA
jgi:ketosteroid isomerase-like protein